MSKLKAGLINMSFENFFSFVERSEIAHVMRETVENSPWHREANVWEHTKMVLGEYEKILSTCERSERDKMLTRVALLFHDFGKPEAEETLDKKDGSGVYRSYAGHEKVSANEFISFVTATRENWDAFQSLGLNLIDARTIKFMIEHHLPYGLKNEKKRADLSAALHHLEVVGHCSKNVFFDMLRSDARGRISDDHEQKLKNVETWIEDFSTVAPSILNKPNGNSECLVLVGPSGAGKSTWVKNNVQGDFASISEDDLRLEFATTVLGMTKQPDEGDQEWYDRYWYEIHMNDKNSKEFDVYVKTRFNMIVKSKMPIVIDNTNRSKKRRLRYTRELIEKGYHVTTVEFFISEQTLNKRQSSRNDKHIKPKYVHEHVMSMEVPWVGVEAHSNILIGPLFE